MSPSTINFGMILGTFVILYFNTSNFMVRKLFICFKIVEIGTYNMILENILFLMKWVSVRSWWQSLRKLLTRGRWCRNEARTLWPSQHHNENSFATVLVWMRLRCSHVGRLLLCSRLLYTEDFSEPFSHALMMKKMSLRIANTAKLDSLLSVLCAVCVYCVSCVLAQVKPLKLFLLVA